jgi:hypothetical protein
MEISVRGQLEEKEGEEAWLAFLRGQLFHGAPHCQILHQQTEMVASHPHITHFKF